MSHKYNIFLSLFQYGLKSFSLTRHLKIKAISIHNLELLPLGVIIKLFFRIKLVYLPHELETEKSGSLPLLNLFYRFIEKFFIIFADYTVTVSKPIEDWYRNNYSLKNIATIRNVPNLNQLNTDYDVEDLRKKFKISEDEPLYIYQGLLSSGRGISLLTKTFEAAKKNIVFMGHGDLSLDIKNIKKKYINYLEPVKMEKICAQTSKADIGVHINEDESLSYKFSLPNKFFEYIHSGIPIIVSPNMEYLAKIIDENNLGWVVSPENLEELIKKINIKDCEILRTNIEKFAKEAIYENDAKIFKNIYMTQ
jgi:glycosyltransferase involved in cell wall biosynthesis